MDRSVGSHYSSQVVPFLHCGFVLLPGYTFLRVRFRGAMVPLPPYVPIACAILGVLGASVLAIFGLVQMVIGFHRSTQASAHFTLATLELVILAVIDSGVYRIQMGLAQHGRDQHVAANGDKVRPPRARPGSVALPTIVVQTVHEAEKSDLLNNVSVAFVPNAPVPQSGGTASLTIQVTPPPGPTTATTPRMPRPSTTPTPTPSSYERTRHNLVKFTVGVNLVVLALAGFEYWLFSSSEGEKPDHYYNVPPNTFDWSDSDIPFTVFQVSAFAQC